MDMKLNDMAKKIGFIGIGQAGGNVCEVAEFYKYRTLVFNTSPEDLASITLVKNQKLLGTSGGCGKDRNEAKAEVKNLYTDIVNETKEVFETSEVELIYVVFSTGGGTGSGMAPIVVDILNQLLPSIHFALMPILPALDESIVSQVNTLECLKEIYQLELPTLIIDNEKYKATKAYTRKKLFDIVNTKAIMNINKIFAADREVSRYGNIDQKDLFKLLNTPGVTVLGEATFTNEEFTTKGMAKLLMEEWSENIYGELDYDKVITRSGYMFTLDETLTSQIDLSELDQKLGVPLEVFEGYYKKEEDEKNSIISIIAGLSFPELRLEMINELLEKSKSSIKTKSENSILAGGDLGNEWFTEMRNEGKVTKESKLMEDLDEENISGNDFSLDDILNKY